MPQLFLLLDDTGRQTAILAKIVDDLLLAGSPDTTNPVIDNINDRFELGTFAHGSGSLLFYGLNITQLEDIAVTIDGDDKLHAIEQLPLSRLRRRDSEAPLNSIEATAFASLNSSVGWLGITASLFYAEFSSRMQQEAPNTVVRHLSVQSICLRQLQNIELSVCYLRLNDDEYHKLSLLVLSDSGRHWDRGQLCYVTGLLIDGLRKVSLYHVLAWSSHLAKFPVKLIRAAEILATGEAIDDGKSLAKTLTAVFRVSIPLLIAVDSKDLFSSLSTQRNSIDKTIRADVNVIRHELERRNVNSTIWIPGRENLADPGTKSDSSRIDRLKLALHDGRRPFKFARAETCSSDRPLW